MFKKIIFLVFLIVIGCSASDGFAQDKKADKKLPRVLFFYSQSCHACQKTKAEVMPAIEKEFYDKVIIENLDIGEIENYKLALGIYEKYLPQRRINVPSVLVGEKVLEGYDQINKDLKNELLVFIQKNKHFDFLNLPQIDLEKYFNSFGPAAIVIAGLVDGVNPCAFAVIAFFVTFLAFQGYRKRDLAVVGAAFILAVFLTYVLVGLGIFRFLYSLNKFYLFSRIFYYLIGAMCFVLAILAFYDLWLFKKTGQSDGLVLQLPKSIKKWINSLIGTHYRRTQEDRAAGIYRKNLPALIISAFVTGFLVSILEAVCTGQTYLPTITYVLKNPALKSKAFFYLVLYNVMFVIPLIGVLIFALLGSVSADFNSAIKRNMALLKFLMGVLFLILGFLMVLGV